MKVEQKLSGLFHGKMKMKRKYENGNKILQNRNGNKVSYVQTEQSFLVERTRKRGYSVSMDSEFPVYHGYYLQHSMESMFFFLGQ